MRTVVQLIAIEAIVIADVGAVGVALYLHDFYNICAVSSIIDSAYGFAIDE